MEETFKIDSLPDNEFRTARIPPVELLALSMSLNFNDWRQTNEVYTYALEHVEVLVGEKWLPVKTKGKEVYWPSGLENNFVAMQDICMWFINNVIAKTFTQSNE